MIGLLHPYELRERVERWYENSVQNSVTVSKLDNVNFHMYTGILFILIKKKDFQKLCLKCLRVDRESWVFAFVTSECALSCSLLCLLGLNGVWHALDSLFMRFHVDGDFFKQCLCGRVWPILEKYLCTCGLGLRLHCFVRCDGEVLQNCILTKAYN